MRPLPPKRLVPPITAAAIASKIRFPPPVFVSTANCLDTEIIPEIAARPEQIEKTMIRILFTCIPVLLAASAFPPTAKICTPNLVYSVKRVKIKVKGCYRRFNTGFSCRVSSKYKSKLYSSQLNYVKNDKTYCFK